MIDDSHMGDSATTPALPPELSHNRGRVEDCVGVSLSLVVAILLLDRLPKGLDLSDESYYAIFLDDWLKGGITSSSFTVVHQTAALTLYPVAKAYVAVRGSTDGMLLFLRYLFFAASCASAALWVCFMRLVVPRLVAWLSGIFLLAFIPFGLPAPSYNTIGVHALCVTLACVGLALSGRSEVAATRWWLAAGVAATVMTIAYPPLALLCAFAVSALAHGGSIPGWYVIAFSSMGIFGWLLVAASLGLERLVQSFTFLGTAADTGGVVAKLFSVGALLSEDALFVVVLLTVAFVGLIRGVPPLLHVLTICVMISLLIIRPPFTLVMSHDVITVLAVSKLSLLVDRTGQHRTLRVLYGCSLGAGLITGMSAIFPASNFALGATPAAAIAVASLSLNSLLVLRLLIPIAACAAVLASSLTVFYREPTSQAGDRRTITAGFFEGIRAAPEAFDTVETFGNRLEPLVQKEPTTYIGPSPGVILTTRARLRMQIAYNILPYPPDSVQQLSRFYENFANRTPTVILHRVEGVPMVNPLGESFEVWYEAEPAYSFAVPGGEVEIYRLKP